MSNDQATTHQDQATVPQDQAADVMMVDHEGTTHQCEYGNSELGDLDKRFDPGRCQPATDQEVHRHNLRVVVFVDRVEHVLHCGQFEYYLVDSLKTRDHSFENGNKLLDTQTSSHIIMSYHYSNDISVVRPGGEMYNKHFKSMQISFPMIAKFILQHGKANPWQDGDQASIDGKKHQIRFGCCGQVSSLEKVNGYIVPVSTYGTDVFDDDPMIKQMIANAMVARQDVEDKIEMFCLNKARPFYHHAHLEQFGKPLRECMGAKQSCQEDFVLQLKWVS
jgi:hypothetical protein